MWSLRVTPIVGLPTYVDWSQAATFPLDSGKFVILLSVRGQSAAVLGQSLLNEIETAPPQNVQELHELLTDLLENHPADEFSVACLLTTEGKVTLGALRASILLHRDATTGKVLPASDEISLRSGKSKPDDVYILLNEQGEQFIPAIEQHFSNNLVPDVVATMLVPAVQSTISDSGAAAIALVEVIEEAPAIVEAADDVIELASISKPIVQYTQPKFPKFSTRLMAKGRRVGVKVWLLLRSFKFRRNAVYVQTALQDQWRKRALVLVGTVLFFVAISIGSWWWYTAKQRTVQTELAPLEERLFFAQNLVNSDPIAARQAVTQVVIELELLSSTKGKQRFVGTKYTTALAQAQEVLIAISGKIAVEALPVFYDLRLAQSEMVTSASHISGTKAVFVDAEKRQVVTLDLSSKKVQLFSLSELAQLQATTAANNILYVLSDGLWALELTDDATPKEIKPSGDSNKAGALLGSFGPYLYVLNPEKRNVFRYTQTADGVSDPIGWIIDPLQVSYDTITSMSIDGDIWFGTDAGEIFRYASGRKQAFTSTGLEEPFSSALFLSASADSDNLFVLEAGKQRLVILSKEGTFLREVKSPSIATVTSFFVDEASGFAYVTSGSTVYQIALAI